MLTGVCGGLAEYMNLDPTIVRLLCALLCCSGSGLIVYIIAAVVMPEAPNDIYSE
ncbi:MAG: PspC domain-containing protein [Lachnospiraceae bacterium]|nr:PspC domain-containing protein [Lachnospiraceae bacterium]